MYKEIQVKTRYVLLFLSLILVSCSASFDKDFEAAMGRESGPEVLNALLALDQSYPETLKVKVNIGALYLLLGQYERAAVYLEQGKKLDRWYGNKKTRYLLYANLAELYYAQASYQQAIDAGSKALELDESDSVGAAFVRAKALAALEEYEQALTAFDTAIESHPDLMNKTDHEILISTLIKTESYERLITEIGTYAATFGYSPGLGLHESMAYQRLGRVEESLFAAFKELEYRRFYGIVSEEELSSSLDAMSTALSASDLETDEGKRLIAAFHSYLAGDYGKAYEMLHLTKADTSFATYLVLATLLESGEEIQENFSAYADLEQYFSDLPGYYYHAWRALERLPSTSFANVQPLLEKTIQLAPATGFAREARIQLGRLVGIEGPEAALILTKEESNILFSRALSTGDPSYLVPLIKLQETNENIYQLHAYLRLTEALKYEAFRRFCSAQQPQLGPLATERMASLLIVYGK